nr:RagB/SusD family nutrient uptake outer membrane protein [uncultured Bacteroides sp.]
MKYKYLLGLICILFSSCNDFLTEYSQDQAYVTSYNDLDELLIGNAYMKHYITQDYQSSNTQSYYPYIHFMDDELIQNGTGEYSFTRIPEFLFGYYTWQREVSKDPNGDSQWPESQDWNNLYSYIGASNMILSLIDKQSVATTNDSINVKRIKGEAYFLRGSYYFTLVNLYGLPYSTKTADTDPGVPIKLTESIEDKYFSRNTVKDVYDQIIQDLLNSVNYLKDVPHKSWHRADYPSACLMLSRVYLYKQDYANALKYAQLVIDKKPTLVNLNTFAGTQFLSADNSELLFSTGTSQLPANLGTYTGGFSVSPDLYHKYNSNDLRTTYFVKDTLGRILDVKQTPLEQGLYDYYDISDHFVLRVSEAYLNLAEAAAITGKDELALNALNILLQNRIRTDKFTLLKGITGAELVQYVRDERCRELCLEGHRWFDLRRYKVNDLYPYKVIIEHDYTSWSSQGWSYFANPTRRYTLTPDDPAWVLSIPKSEIIYNEGMIDNQRNARSYKIVDLTY